MEFDAKFYHEMLKIPLNILEAGWRCVPAPKSNDFLSVTYHTTQKKFLKNSSITVWVIMLPYRQTDRQTTQRQKRGCNYRAIKQRYSLDVHWGRQRTTGLHNVNSRVNNYFSNIDYLTSCLCINLSDMLRYSGPCSLCLRNFYSPNVDYNAVFGPLCIEACLIG